MQRKIISAALIILLIAIVVLLIIVNYEPPVDPEAYRKPVIYLYPEEECDVSVELDLNGQLTCTYPQYNEGWQVTASPDSAKLNISPAPDTVIRVFMTFKASDEFVKIPQQNLTAPSREGFTVVEWGGSEIE